MASKRGQRRKARKPRKPPPPPDPPRVHRTHEDWVAAREAGRMIVIPPSPLSAAEQEECWGGYLDELELRRRHFAEVKAEAHLALARCDAFDLLAAVQIAFTREMPRGREPDLHRVPAGAELLALFLVEGAREHRRGRAGSQTKNSSRRSRTSVSSRRRC